MDISVWLDIPYVFMTLEFLSEIGFEIMSGLISVFKLIKSHLVLNTAHGLVFCLIYFSVIK